MSIQIFPSDPMFFLIAYDYYQITKRPFLFFKRLNTRNTNCVEYADTKLSTHKALGIVKI